MSDTPEPTQSVPEPVPVEVIQTDSFVWKFTRDALWNGVVHEHFSVGFSDYRRDSTPFLFRLSASEILELHNLLTLAVDRLKQKGRLP